MKKIILEELENMKYLLGYKRGVVISEQTPGTYQADDNNINPSTGQPASTTPASTTPAPAAAATPVTPIKIGVKNPSIEELQNTLNTKFQSGLTPDGKYGPKTAASILAALSKTSTTTPTNTIPVNTVVGGDASSEAIKKTAEANASTGVVANSAPAAQNTSKATSGTIEVDSSEFS